MTLQTSRKGYKTVVLHKSNKCKTHQVHRLVATAFIPNPYNLPQVNHKDVNKFNNKIDNLEWITNYDNIQHAIQNNCFGKFTEKQYEAVLKNLEIARKQIIKSVVQYTLSGEFLNRYNSINEAAEKTHTNASKITACCKGNRKTTNNFKWSYYKEEL